jgi:pyrroloquinoline-quinone synthase
LNLPVAPEELERRLREIGRERSHHRHPFHRLLQEGRLGRGQVQAWALNRFYYQSLIPLKDAAILSRARDVEFRRAWRQRLVDQDGDTEGEGAIARWLLLTESLGLDRELVVSCQGVLPAVRFAAEANLRFVRERSLLEAVASSLTELFAPGALAERVAGMLAHYDFVRQEALAYFQARMEQAPRESAFALGFVKREARTPEQQEAVMGALIFKCDTLWAQLDALFHAYVQPGQIPAGAFVPEDR